MDRKGKSSFPEPTANEESKALDALNVRMRRTADVARVMEANIESKAKKRRRREASLSSALK